MRSADPESFAGTDRFVVQRRLGAGCFGVVYEVLDRERNTNVALKTLRVGAGRTLYRFKQEFRALADVSHPNLVTLYELLSDGEQWFFTMELVDGVDFLEHVRGDDVSGRSSGRAASRRRPRRRWTRSCAPGPRPAPGPLRPASAPVPSGSGEQLSTSRRAALRHPGLGPMERLRQALAAAGAGRAARCTPRASCTATSSPRTCWSPRDGRVVLLDFGLVPRAAPGPQRTRSDAVGTPAYMSPEQAAERPLTEASDWYSVGVMLYEALTGALPFAGPALEVLRRKQLDEPPAPARAGAGDSGGARRALPQPAAPRARPAAVRRRVPAPPARSARPPPRSRRRGRDPAAGRRPRPALRRAGRRELARLARGLRDVKARARDHRRRARRLGHGQDRARAPVPGRARAQSPPPVILAGRCYERESVPYKALDALVDALSQHLRRLAAGARSRPSCPTTSLALARALPRAAPGAAR